MKHNKKKLKKHLTRLTYMLNDSTNTDTMETEISNFLSNYQNLKDPCIKLLTNVLSAIDAQKRERN